MTATAFRAPAGLSRPPALFVGEGAVGQLLADLPEDVLLILDPMAPVSWQVAETLGRLPQDQVRAVSGDVTVAELDDLAAWIAQHPGAAVLAVGGGTVIDAAKLAAVAADWPERLDLARRAARRASLVVLPGHLRRNRQLYAVPTTLGTGVEASSVACMALADRRILVLGNGLAVDAAAVDPVATAGLPGQLVREGVAEAFLRVLGPYVSSPPHAVADAESRFLMVQLAGLLSLPDEEVGSADNRLAAACWSGSTHRGLALTGRPPLGSPLWFLANELAFATGTRKVPATAALVLPWLERVSAGDERWGRRQRLAETPLGAADVAAAWGSWRLDATLVAPPDLDGLVTATQARWGGRLPMLGRFETGDLRGIFADAVTGAGR